jgi:hypothetical protein
MASNHPASLQRRLFIGINPTGILYSDRGYDYRPIAFMPWSTLELQVFSDCPDQAMVRLARQHASAFEDRVGEIETISASGQTVVLGEEKAPKRRYQRMTQVIKALHAAINEPVPEKNTGLHFPHVAGFQVSRKPDGTSYRRYWANVPFLPKFSGTMEEFLNWAEKYL